MRLISAGGLQGKGSGGHAVKQIVFSRKSRVETLAIRYWVLELVFFKAIVLSHTETVHVAEDASESAFIGYIFLLNTQLTGRHMGLA